MRKTNLHLLFVVMCVSVRCVCGLSQVNFHLFPEPVAHRCTALDTLNASCASHQALRALVESCCAQRVYAQQSPSDFHCVRGKLHGINFSSRRLVFAKFIFHVVCAGCLWSELFSPFPIWPLVSSFFSYTNIYFLVISLFSLFIFFLWIFNANFSPCVWVCGSDGR